jgi:hypothetical protein
VRLLSVLREIVKPSSNERIGVSGSPKILGRDPPYSAKSTGTPPGGVVSPSGPVMAVENQRSRALVSIPCTVREQADDMIVAVVTVACIKA